MPLNGEPTSEPWMVLVPLGPGHANLGGPQIPVITQIPWHKQSYVRGLCLDCRMDSKSQGVCMGALGGCHGPRSQRGLWPGLFCNGNVVAMKDTKKQGARPDELNTRSQRNAMATLYLGGGTFARTEAAALTLPTCVTISQMQDGPAATTSTFLCLGAFSAHWHRSL